MYLGRVLFIVAGKILAILIGLLFYGRLSKGYRIILAQVFAALIAELAGGYIAYVLLRHNIWLFNVYGLADIVLTSLAGYYLVKNATFKKWILPINLVAVGIWTANVAISSINVLQTWALCLMSVTVVIVYFPILLEALFSKGKLLKSANFWLCISIILYFCCSIPYYGVFNYLYKANPPLLLQLFNIINVLNFVRYPLIALAFYLHSKQNSLQDAELVQK